MKEPDWFPVLNDADMPEGALIAVYPMGINIVLTRFMGKVYAIDGKCMHMACPLSSGSIDGPILTCPCHDWRFDVRTGEFVDAKELSLATHPIRTENGKILVGLRSKGESDE
jgi:3-phenylpropionate/trans-cinnamate dioxygenase ferredoxin subunit